ncbi:hypothetical protein LCGC14_1370810 [marine sediment metagenome]|uniref:Uncharacterized protein n=1 Tax=marine sediment metagenome TaxID=412755 RepID=A0A0F9N7F8_9ZZZZ
MAFKYKITIKKDDTNYVVFGRTDQGVIGIDSSEGKVQFAADVGKTILELSTVLDKWFQFVDANSIEIEKLP